MISKTKLYDEFFLIETYGTEEAKFLCAVSCDNFCGIFCTPVVYRSGDETDGS